MKRLILATLLSLLSVLPQYAQTFTVGDFTYEVIEGTNVRVTATSLAANSDIVIPETVEFENIEYTITELNRLDSDKAFKSLYISKTIESIYSYYIFYHGWSGGIQESLEVDPENQFFKIVDGNLYSLDGTKFYGCPKQSTEVHVIDGVKEICMGACSSSLLQKVTLPEGLETISQLAFAYSRLLTDINIPESVRIIDRYAFLQCPVSSFSIGKNLEKLGENPFADCNIEEFDISEDNPNFADYDGCIYSKDFKKFIMCPDKKTTVKFHPGVECIEEYAFSFCDIESITLPESITNIQQSAFRYCVNLKEITIPATINIISYSSFDSCHSLQKIILKDGLTSIEQFAFLNCYNLNCVTIPESVTSIRVDAFGCQPYYNHETSIILTNPDTKILYNGSLPDLANNFYATGNTLKTLQEMLPNMPYSKVYQLPEKVFMVAEPIVMGANSAIEWQCPLTVKPASGVQFDMTLPGGLNVDDIVSNNENLKVSFTKLENGDYRVIAYTSDNSEIEYADALTFNFSSDASLTRSNILIHNGMLSVFESELECQDQEILVTGYSVDINLPETMIEGESIELPNPIEGTAEDVTYTWDSFNTIVATIEDNNMLKAGKVGMANISLTVTDPEFTKSYAHQLEVLAALWGDVDGNEAVDIADLVAMINYILERNPENFDEKLADIDRNGRINIVDVTSLVKIILAQSENSEAAYAPAMHRSVKFGTVETDGTEVMNIPLEIEAGSAYSAMQGEIVLSEGLTLENISLNGELGDHSIDYAMVNQTTARFIIYSSSLAEMNTDEQKPMINLTVKGNPNQDDVITLTNAIAVDAECAATKIDDTSVGFGEIVSIKGIALDGNTKITDLSGRKIREATTPGIYLVTYPNGRTSKVIIK